MPEKRRKATLSTITRAPPTPIPRDRSQFSCRMRVPAGIREQKPWTIALSGLTSAQPVMNQFFLDRQYHLSIFHEKLELIVSGANSKRQPELATFTETMTGRTSHLPISTALRMEPGLDLLSLAYNTFFADLEVAVASSRQVAFHFAVTEMGGRDAAVHSARAHPGRSSRNGQNTGDARSRSRGAGTRRCRPRDPASGLEPPG